MRRLALPPGFPLPGLQTELADGDTMFDGREAHYLDVGLSALACIEAALQGRSPRSILDLPCGYGRVTRMLRARFPAARLTVCDLDRAGVDFAARQFGAQRAYSVEDLGSLRLPDRYELIWVGSLVTHLSEAQTGALLDRMAACMEPGAVLVVSSHGPSIADGLRSWGYGLQPSAAASVLDAYAAGGYGHAAYGASNGYGVALTDRSWWEAAVAGRGLELVSYAEQAWDGHQDVVTLRRVADGVRTAAPPAAKDVVRARAAAAAYDPVLRWFDPAYYLGANPDVAQAVDAGDYTSAWDHFRRRGRAEGRPGRPEQAGATAFDEAFYRAANPDVDAAIGAGAFRSGRDHYDRFGRAEGRLPCASAQPGPAASGAAMKPGAAMTAEERRDRVAAVWSVDVEQAPGWYWMAHPMVRARLNRLVSGDPEVDSYGHLANLLRARGLTVPIERAVSLGCGFGGLERDLAGRGLIREIDAYDIAPGAIAEARRLAQAGGFTGIRYHVADLETEALAPGQIDVVFAHQSVHHVERLDPLFAAVSAMLKPGGIFHLHEFVGPIRFQWTDAQIAEVNRFLEALPPRLRALPSGRPRPLQARPTVEAMIAADPSEAIRSSEILTALRRHFDIIEERPIGGALLHLGLGGIAQNFADGSAEDRAALDAFFAAEDAAMRAGLVGSDFVVVTAVKRAGG